ncbi:S41 family peptidase [Meiothermus rufus]|uniref:S41 family peptidase n=1 Tax=Meiothermus rufus TaxID=604332 RepID=UPI000408405A|nr:S41 family peptidase [Meiothermus rufus]
MHRWAVGLFLLLGLALAQNPQDFALRLEQAWRLVKERYYDPSFNGVDWEAVGQRYRQKLPGVQDWEGLYHLLDQMYAELGDDHSRVLSPAQAQRYLGAGGGRCLALPFQTPEPYQPPQVRFSEGVVVVRLQNLVERAGLEALQEAIRRYEAQAVGYVLDLRGNPGGLALRMAEVAGVFLRGVPWRLVSRGLGAVPLPTVPFWGLPQTQKPLVVLIDGGVHSAAEGLAGALKNAGRAYLIGTRSAGNTEALTPYCFPDGGVALVAGGVLAPLVGPTWEGRGVEPDLVVEDPAEQLEAALRYLKRP